MSAIDLNGARAAMIVEGAIDRLTYEGFLKWLLLPTLRPGDIVVFDSLPTHKGNKAAGLVALAGAMLEFLAPY